MTELQKQFMEETGVSFDGIPINGVHLEYITWLESLVQALRQPPVSGELNCEHDWLVDMYDHFGFPASRFCDKCNTREAI